MLYATYPCLAIILCITTLAAEIIDEFYRWPKNINPNEQTSRDANYFCILFSASREGLGRTRTEDVNDDHTVAIHFVHEIDSLHMHNRSLSSN